jgi:DNA-binding NarL/FixJ family response regulator
MQMKRAVAQSPRDKDAGAPASLQKIAVKVHARDALTRAGISSLLKYSTEFSEVSLEADGEPDVFIVVTEYTDATTLELLEKLSPSGAGRFMLIVDQAWQAGVYAAVERGVRAMLWRSNFSLTTLTQSLHAVVNGEGLFPPGLQGRLMQQVQQVHRDVLAPRGLTASIFSDREIDVLRLLSEGLDLDQISRKMQYSERTVKNILYSAMKRHQFRNRTHAVSYAIRSGLI